MTSQRASHVGWLEADLKAAAADRSVLGFSSWATFRLNVSQSIHPPQDGFAGVSVEKCGTNSFSQSLISTWYSHKKTRPTPISCVQDS